MLRRPKVQFTSQPTTDFTHDERSPSSTTEPIRIAYAGPVQEKFTVRWIPVSARVHHQLDNITDYYQTGTHGWEDGQKNRVKQSERKIGRSFV